MDFIEFHLMFMLTGVYGCNDREDICELCSSLSRYCTSVSDDLWQIMGDFTIVIAPNERLGAILLIGLK